MAVGADGTGARAGSRLLELYPRALPEVFGYLLARCRDVSLAEDLTSEAFYAAAGVIAAGSVAEITTGWLIVVARRRLIDHWRRQELEQRHLQVLAQAGDDVVDEWDDRLDAMAAREALGDLAPHHRAALTLRYLDGLGIDEVASQLERGHQATEALLHRARLALRRAYESRGNHAD